MLRLLLLTCFTSLALCQDETTVPHKTHHTHKPHHTHPTEAPVVEHTFKDTNVVFIQDLPNKAMVMKSDSGCYLTHLNDHQLEEIKVVEKLLHLEAAIVHHVRTAHHFFMANNPNQYSHAVQKSCPKLYSYHKE